MIAYRQPEVVADNETPGPEPYGFWARVHDDARKLMGPTIEELACYEAACAPPPVGTGGSSVKGPSKGRLSPDATGRLSPTPEFTTVRAAVQYFGGSERALKAEFGKIYGGPLGAGYEAFVDQVFVYSDRIEVQGVIVSAAGDKAGMYKRNLEFEAGDIVAHHDVFNLRSDHQGKGLAQAYNDKLLKFYDKIGVDRIELEAALAGGPYAWARQGYQFNGYPAGWGTVEKQRKEWVEDRIQFIKTKTQRKRARNEIDQETFDLIFEEAIALSEASRMGKNIQPIHVAAIGEGNPKLATRNGTSWPGKDALISIDGDNESERRPWYGVYYLGKEKKDGSLTAALKRRIEA